MRRAEAGSAPEVRNFLQDKAVELQQIIQDPMPTRKIPPELLDVAHETGLWNGPVPFSTKMDPFTLDAGVLRYGDKHRDTGIVTLRTAAEIVAQFLRHHKQVTSGRGDQSMACETLFQGLERSKSLDGWKVITGHGNEEESVVILHRLGDHPNRQVLANFREGRVEPFLLRAQIARVISLCDNSFFSSLKSRFPRMQTSTTEATKTNFLKSGRIPIRGSSKTTLRGD
jgi:hypothetical protein